MDPRDDNEIARRQIRAAIIRHLELYPDASDTVDGIQRFWVAGRDAEPDLALVEAVLEALVQDGVLRIRRLPDGGVIFSATAPRQPNHRPS